MDESGRRQESIQQQKAKIRCRYQGIDLEKIHVIPVTVSQPDFEDDSTPKRVAVYARVSTGDPRQTSSYELQKNYYERTAKLYTRNICIYSQKGRRASRLGRAYRRAGRNRETKLENKKRFFLWHLYCQTCGKIFPIRAYNQKNCNTKWLIISKKP